MKQYFNLKEVFKYFFRKEGLIDKDNVNLSAMHVMNRIAIILGLIGVIIVLYKNLK